MSSSPQPPRAGVIGLVALGLALSACGTRLANVDTGVPLSDADLAMGWSKPENRKADDFSEQLVVRGRLSDGASLYAKLTVTNLASADGRADMTVNVELADHRKLKFRAKAERDDWSWSKERFHAEVGDGVIDMGVGRATIKCQNEAFELEATIESSQPPLRPEGGFVKQAGGYYVTTIPIPRGSLHVKLLVHEMPEPEEVDDEPGDKPPEPEPPAAEPPPEGAPRDPPDGGSPELPPDVAPEAGADGTGSAPAPGEGGGGDGEDDDVEEEPGLEEEEGPVSLELEGVAYAEHRMSTLTPYALAHRWYGIVDVGEERTVVFSAFEHARTKEQKKRRDAPPPVVQGWILAAHDDGLELYEPALRVWTRELTSDDKTGYTLPGVVFVSDPKWILFEGVIKLNAMSNRKDDLGSLKKIERLVVRRFMKPWTFRYDRAEFLFRRQEPERPRIEVRGTARLQYQQLNE